MTESILGTISSLSGSVLECPANILQVTWNELPEDETMMKRNKQVGEERKLSAKCRQKCPAKPKIVPQMSRKIKWAVIRLWHECYGNGTQMARNKKAQKGFF